VSREILRPNLGHAATAGAGAGRRAERVPRPVPHPAGDRVGDTAGAAAEGRRQLQRPDQGQQGRYCRAGAGGEGEGESTPSGAERKPPPRGKSTSGRARAADHRPQTVATAFPDLKRLRDGAAVYFHPRDKAAVSGLDSHPPTFGADRRRGLPCTSGLNARGPTP
jgi:hypothetical protein